MPFLASLPAFAIGYYSGCIDYRLAPVACDILSVPVSSISVECSFSISREASRQKRNRLVDHNLEQEMLVRKNKKYFKKAYLLLASFYIA